MPYPVRTVTKPASLACAANGQLTSSQLTPIGHGGQLEPTAARAWAALWLAAQSVGIALTWTPGGTYRKLADQVWLFQQRYTTDPPYTWPTYQPGMKPPRHEVWNGQGWWLKPGVAGAAVPGTSNHGLGLAIDVALGDEPAQAKAITSATIKWLVENEESLGWSHEDQSEPWHLRYFAGDAVPARVLEIEAWMHNVGSAAS